MKTLKSFYIFLLLCLTAILPSHASDFSQAQMKKMSILVSNFTEIGMRDFRSSEILDMRKPEEMIHFAVWHNYMNTFHKTLKECHCSHGDLAIDGAFVKENLKRYFDYDLKFLPNTEHYYSDGKQYHFYGADGDPVYYAKVTSAKTLDNGHVQMKGYLYNIDEKSDVLGDFMALAKPHTWKGQPTWAILSLKTFFRR